MAKIAKPATLEGADALRKRPCLIYRIDYHFRLQTVWLNLVGYIVVNFVVGVYLGLVSTQSNANDFETRPPLVVVTVKSHHFRSRTVSIKYQGFLIK